MASRTGTGLLLPAVIVVGLIAVFGGSKVVSSITGIIGDHDPVIVGSGDSMVMVAANAESKVKGCPVDQAIATKRCGDVKLLVINAAKMPYIARNISLAWGEGKAAVLHRDAPDNRTAKYELACGRKSSFVVKHRRGRRRCSYRGGPCPGAKLPGCDDQERLLHDTRHQRR